ncbi:MAG: ammonium transporter [Parvularculaceae bacterium]
MIIKRKKWTLFAIVALVAALAAVATSAQDSSTEIQPATDTSRFVLNTLFFLVMGMVVMFMSAGFSMLEVGLARAKNAASVCIKNIAVLAIAALMTWLVGYNLIYGVEPGGLLGAFAVWSPDDADPMSAGRASGAHWFLQMAFAAVAAMIVAGALAERAKLWPFLLFATALTGVIYPIGASWVWGAGYLDEAFKFKDFAGATVVHAAAGWAALAAAIIIGPRAGKYAGGRVNSMPGSNLPLAALGALILWLGWFGLNGGSQLALGAIADSIAISRVFVNTDIAGAAGVAAAIILTQIIYKKIDLTAVLNGAIGGLVSISADPVHPAMWQAAVIGAFGGVIVTVAAPMLDRLRIDDVVGAIPAHLFCGVWGTFIVPWSNKDATVLGQIVGILMIGAFVFVMSLLAWVILKYTVGVRASAEAEQHGLDRAELGVEAYPGFAQL